MANLPERVQEALYDLEQYLSDAAAPLVVAESLTLLMECAPEVMATQVQAWAIGQYRGAGARLPLSDYLFHAVKKVYLLGEFDLIDRAHLAAFLAKLAPLILDRCPEQDRPLLVESMAQLAEPTAHLAAPAEYIHRQKPPEAQRAEAPEASTEPLASAPATQAAAQAGSGSPFARAAEAGESARASRLLTLLLERLERDTETTKAVGAASQATAAMAAQILTAVAARSTDEQGLNADLARLKQFGIAGGMDSVFRTLSEGLPGWALPGNDAVAARSGVADAMRRLIMITEDASEAASRLHEMVKTAVERFNAGSLAKAVAMYEVAEGIIAEHKVKSSVAEAIRRNGHEYLEPDRLRAYAEKPETHPALRVVLSFYDALRIEGLLDELEIAEKRDRRRYLLALLEVHGVAARDAALTRLVRSFTGSIARDDWYFQRNLVHLLRRLPRRSVDHADDELEALARLADPQRPMPLVKEVISALAQTRHERAELVLARLLGHLEERLADGELSADEREELWSLLDRLAPALARLGTLSARRTLVAHGLKRDLRLGLTSARLEELASLDLAAEPAVVERLLAALQEELPRKLLGVAVKRNSDRLLHLIRALSGTPAVRKALQQVSEKHPDTDFGRAARKAIAGPPGAAGAPPHRQASSAAATGAEVAGERDALSTEEATLLAAAGGAAALSGDLDLFGLPNLLQSLAGSQVTGALILENAKKEPLAALWLKRGQLVDAKFGGLDGPVAVYQLLERPMAATFNFLSQAESTRSTQAGAEKDVEVLLLEGLRRYDELQRTLPLVPDRASFVTTGVTPSAPPEEINVNTVTEVWQLIVAGENPLEAELETHSDSYTVHRLLCHWLEEGSLKPR